MSRQPNIELRPADKPRTVLRPGPARRWRPSMRPGVITSADQMPRGEGFGTPGPDTGWALRLIERADIPDSSPGLDKLLTALMSARASSFGRAPIWEDLEVALALCGLGEPLSEHLADRRQRWVKAVSHEKPPGRLALSEVGMELLRSSPSAVRVSKPE